MKTLKKLIPVLLSLVFVVSSIMTITAFAATSNQDGLDATLSFAKTEYAANEDIATTLTVKNNNSYTVKDIQTEITLPDGISLKSGNLTQEKFDLTANDSKVQELTLIKIVQATEPSTDNTDNSQTGTPSDDTNSPQTGDNSHIGIFVILMILSGGALLIIGIKQKKLHIKGMMSIVLCFALVGAMLPMTAFAASEQKSFTVEETVKIDGKDTTVKATVSYEFVQYSNVTVTNGTGTGLYAEGETVTITADEAPEGKHFAGWTVEKGNVTLADSNNSTTTFVMSAENVEVKANYDVNTYTITVETGANGEITPNAAEVQYGGEQKFEIKPVTGYHIVDVEIDGVSKGAITEYTFENVKETHTIKATFAIDTFTITATAGANGTITETATVNYGDSKTFTITPNTGYHIADVKVDDTSVGAKTSYEFKNVTANHKIEVSFAIDTFTIEVTSGENGAISPAGEVSVNYGENQTFTITPNAHYHIVDVEIDGVSKGVITKYTFENVKETHTIKATFAIDIFTITATANAGGTITETATVNYGDSKTFTITPNADYHIEKVEVDEENKGAINTYTFTDVKEAHTIKVTFAINPYTITATAGANGSITESAKLNTGDSKTFTMTANSGYGVKDVKVDGTSVGPVTSYTFENVNENHTIEVVFDKATTVSTAQDFRDAVTKDGIIVLANDITLDDNGDVEISKNVIIRGNGHTIFMPVYSGTNWSHPINITAKSGAVVSLECCNVSGNGTLNIWFGATMYIYNVVVDNIYCESSVYFDSGEISGDISINNATLVVLNDVKVSRESEFSFSDAREAFRHRGKEFWDICSIRGGTYYFDISDYLNPDLYKATQTKDANGVDIWVVTAK